MSNYMNNKKIFFGISSLNVLNTTITRASEISLVIDKKEELTIKSPMSYDDFKKANKEACNDFGFTKEDYIRHYLGKYLKDNSKNLVNFLYGLQFVEEKEGKFYFTTKTDEGESIKEDHFYIENLIEIFEQYKSATKTASEEVKPYIKYLLHPMKKTGKWSSYNWAEGKNSEIVYKGCYYQLVPYSYYVDKQVGCDKFFYCNEFNRITEEDRIVNVKFKKQFFSEDIKLYEKKFKNIFDQKGSDLVFVKNYKEKEEDGLKNLIEKKPSDFNFQIAITVNEQIDDEKIKEIVNSFTDLANYFVNEGSFNNDTVQTKEAIEDKKKELENKKNKLKEYLEVFNKLEEANKDNLYSNIFKYLKETEFSLPSSSDAKESFKFSDVLDTIKENIKVEISAGFSVNMKISYDCSVIETIIKDYISKTENNLKNSVSLDDIEDYKNVKEQYENEMLMDRLKFNILHETSFDIKALKGNLNAKKITAIQYKELAQLYSKTVLSELDAICKRIKEGSKGDKKEEAVEIKLENKPTDTLETKIKNIKELGYTDEINAINAKIEELKNAFNGNENLKKVYKDKNIFDDLGKTVSDIITEIEDNKKTKKTIKLQFALADNCKFKPNYNKLSSITETIEILEFSEIIGKIKQLTGDSNSNVFSIKKGNDIISDISQINDNDTLIIILSVTSNAVISNTTQKPEDRKPESDESIENLETDDEEQKPEQKPEQDKCCNSTKKKIVE